MPLNLNITGTVNGKLYFQDSDGCWKVLGTIKNAEMKIDFVPEAEQMLLVSILEDYLRRFE